MHIVTCRFPPPYDRCSSGTTKGGIVCLRRYDVPAHGQDRVDPLHSFNPFILFTGRMRFSHPHGHFDHVRTPNRSVDMGKPFQFAPRSWLITSFRIKRCGIDAQGNDNRSRWEVALSNETHLLLVATVNETLRSRHGDEGFVSPGIPFLGIH